MSLQNIFSVPISTSYIPEEIANILESNITPRLNRLERKGPQFTDFFSTNKIVSLEEIKPFIELIKQKVHEFSIESSITYFHKFEYWIQDYISNDYHGTHAHPHSSISGTYYIRANEHAGKLRFSNPNPFYTMTLCNGDSIGEKLYHNITPQKGLLVLFPSWLSHEVLPSSNPKDCIRTSFSFNLSIDN